MPQRLWNGLLAIAKRIGHAQAWLILTAFYFLVLAPVAAVYRLMADPLRLRPRRGSIWHPRPPIADRMAWATSQS